MTTSKNQLQRFAMYFGTYMGAYWGLKFIAFPLSFTVPFMSMAYFVLTLAVPFLGYYYTKSYRNKACGGYLSFGNAVLFVLLMYMFASLLAAVVHFVYFEFIDQGYVLDQYTLSIHNLMETPGVAFDREVIENMLQELGRLSSTEITMQILSVDMTAGAFLSIPTALFVARRNPEGEGADQQPIN